jgi:hypothetical protein
LRKLECEYLYQYHSDRGKIEAHHAESFDCAIGLSKHLTEGFGDRQKCYPFMFKYIMNTALPHLTDHT